MKILVLNSGSSSLKYQLIETATKKLLAKGNFERIGQDDSFLTHNVDGVKHKFQMPARTHKEALSIVIERLMSKEYGVIESLEQIDGIGHRIVHGGEKFKHAQIVTPEVIEGLKECIELAPLHNPSAIAGIEACIEAMPNKLNVVCFDTAFHQTIPQKAFMYHVPYKYYEKYKIRKYGFHGISHEYVANRVEELLKGKYKELKIVNCHLGQGASICAIQNGKSVETSMGFTPVAGIPMVTRSGDLDPSVVTYLMKKENILVEDMEKMLNEESGMYGISKVSVDCRDIENEAIIGNHRALLAIDNFSYLIAQYIARYTVAMQGINVLTFTAGIGEKSPIIRRKICSYLKVLGIELDDAKNELKNAEMRISKDSSKVDVFVIPTNEELMIAKETEKLLK